MKSIEEWPADHDLVWVLLIYPGLNELVFGFQVSGRDILF
jgi:hypothetical protein